MGISDQGLLSGRYLFVPRTLIFLTHGSQVLLLKGAGLSSIQGDVVAMVFFGVGIMAAAARRFRKTLD